MNVTRAFSFAFDDRDWLAKLAMAFIVAAAAALFTPILVGLGLWATLLGWMTDLVRNLRAGMPRPLPRWDDVGGLTGRGLPVFGAVVAYNIPNALLGCCLYTLLPSLNNSFTGTGVGLGIACCVFPMLLVYNLLTAPMLALGIGRYTDDPRIGVFFEFGSLFSLIQQHLNVTIQFLLSLVVAYLLFALLAAIPCLGWVAAPALLAPVMGALIGQYASLVLGRPKRSLRPAAPPSPVAPYRRRG